MAFNSEAESVANGARPARVDNPCADALSPTPSTNTTLPMKTRDFATVVEALDYAAQGDTGINFYNLKGALYSVIPYREVRERARALARKLAGRFSRGERIAVVAETSPDFFVTFFACQYAGLIPAPMPTPVNLGGKEGYLLQVRQMVQGANASAAIGPGSLIEFITEAVEKLDCVAVYDFDSLHELTTAAVEPKPLGPDDNCYIQYSSGSTSAPKGVIGTQRSVTSNLHGIAAHGLKLTPGDRAVCWLPLYHDMGLIGFVLSPMYGQCSADFLATSDFVRRPLLWLRIMSENKTTITYSPSFGYELSAKRAKRAEHDSLDLSNLRIAGIGGDMVRPEALNRFTEAFEGVGFNPDVFLPSYGMAETTLAISFTDIDAPLKIDDVDMRHYTRSSVAQPASTLTSDEHRRAFVVCGRALPEHAIEVRGENGNELKDREVGRIFIKGPSLTPGYYSDPDASAAMYDGEWLNTGDMGYSLDGEIVITGRVKDLIILNGRNIWPQDIEWAVERVEGIRQGGVAAFSLDDGKGERVVVVAECRGMSAEARQELQRTVARVVQTAAGTPAEIILAKPHSMVMTSSGKLSRAKVKQKYLDGAFTEDRAETTPSLAEARV